MADKPERISELNGKSTIADNDLMVVVDTDAIETKKITGKDIKSALQSHQQNTDTGLGGLSAKSSPGDGDKVIIRDSSDSDRLKTSTWVQIKAFLKSYWDTLYAAINHTHAQLHDRRHGIGSTSDHSSSITPGKLFKANNDGLPVEATNSDSEVADTVGKKHDRLHSIISSSDHSDVAIGSPVDGDVIYWDEASNKWKTKQIEGGVHGNELHNPDFEEQGVAASLLSSHLANDVHSQGQPAISHGNEKHTAAYITGIEVPTYEADPSVDSSLKGVSKEEVQDHAPQEHGNEAHNPDFEPSGAVSAHAAETSAHSATANATANRIVLRDVSGTAKFAAPANSGEPLVKDTAITDTEHGARGSGLHTDSHNRSHTLDSTSDHSIGGLTSGKLVKSDGTKLVPATNTDTEVSNAVSKAHDRSHALDSTSDHMIGGLTSGRLVRSDGSKLVNATNTDTEVSNAVTKAHDRQHPVTSTSDHTVTGLTASQLLRVNSGGTAIESSGKTAADIASRVMTITFIIDGGGSAITTGQKGHLEIPFACTITGWTLLADQSGSIVIDVWKDTYANFPPTPADTITGSEKPTLSSAQKNQDLALTTWTTAVSAGDILAFNVDSASTVTRVTLSIRVNKT